MKTKSLVTYGVAAAGALIAANPALAQTAGDATIAAVDLTPVGKGLAVGLAGLAVLGGGPGVGRIGGSAVEAVARQPEASGTIFTNMIITAGMVEGATLFAVLAGFLSLFLF